ncbi:cell wall anchor protein, partial [Streptococcus anginosus]
MNKKQVITALVLSTMVFAGAVTADEVTPVDPTAPAV